ncbi:MAG: efflux RND transporter periplasmic adaptor subunit [Planctomycetes bacterium]|nr:efflux RND transporter periplasmic adaptor subunit [Planctomycetota bacterium]
MKKLILVIIVLAIIVGSFFVTMHIRKSDKTQNNNNTEKVVPVAVQEIVRTDLAETMAVFGTVKAINQVDVYAKVSGRVEELLVKNGQAVQAGQVMLVIEHSMIKAQIDQSMSGREAATAQLKQLEINLANLEKELNRISALSKEGAVSESRKDQIETQFKAMQAQKETVQAQVKQLEAVLSQAQINLDEAHLKAPITGVISQRYVEVGDMVTPQRPVFTLIQAERVKIAASVPETVVGRIKAGATKTLINIDTYPDKIFEGLISYVAPAVDARSRNAEIEIELDNPAGLLKPGMFCRIELVLDSKKAVLAVPKDFIIYEALGEDRNYAVYVVQGNIARKTDVKTGIYSRGLVEIKEGLIEGDKVIASVGPHIFDGCKVEVVNGK